MCGVYVNRIGRGSENAFGSGDDKSQSWIIHCRDNLIFSTVEFQTIDLWYSYVDKLRYDREL